MTHTPKVTVVITTHNRADLLPRAVESVLAQTYTDYEIIIDDDCSSDNTQEVIAGLDNPRIRSFRHERNRGLSAARNTAMFNARGKYVALLDDDDEWLPVNLELRVRRFDRASSKVGLVYGWRDVVDDTTGKVRPYTRHTLEGDLFEYLLALNYMAGSPDLMVRLSAAQEIGGFDESLQASVELLFLTQIAQRFHIAVVPQVISRQHAEHGHGRMTDQSFERYLKRVRFYRTYMHVFAEELCKRPKTQALILLKLALTELRFRNWRASLSASAASFRLDPRGTIAHSVRYCVRYCYRRLKGAPGRLERR